MEEQRRTSDREHRAEKELWITAFVNVVVWELRPGINRMIAVAAARQSWPSFGDGPAGKAARAWHAESPV